MNEDELKYLDDILMRDAEELMNDNFVNEVLAVESLVESDEDYTDVDTLVCEEGFVAYTKNLVFGKREQKRKEIEAEELRKKCEYRSKQIDNFIREKKRELFNDIQRRTLEFKNLSLNKKRELLWNKFGSCQRAISNANFIPNRESIIKSDDWEHQMRSEVIQEQAKMKEVVKEFHKFCDNTLQECEKINAEFDRANQNKQKKNGSQVRKNYNTPSQSIATNSAATEEFSTIDAAVLVTLGVALFGKIIAHKVDKKDMGVFRSNREARPYYYILSNEFKKSEKSLKALLKRNKKFVTSKVALEEIVAFRKKYYNRVAMTVNRFMEVFESMESLIGKEKDYSFPEDNPVRDAAITSRLHQRSLKFYELRHSNFTNSAAEVLSFEPEYAKSDDTSKILVDSKYLNDLLRPDETFKCINVLEGIIKKIPSIDDANRYEDLFVNMTGEAAPLRMYISTMLDLRDTALEVRSILNGYINVIYSILDFCVIANENCAIANEGFIAKIKPKYIDYTHLKLAVSSFKKLDKNENTEAEMMRIYNKFNSIYNLANYIRCKPSDFLGMDVDSAKERYNLIKETKLLIAIIEKSIKEIYKTQASMEYDIPDSHLVFYDFIDELNQGLNTLSNSRSSYEGIIVDRKGRELVTDLCKKMVEYYKRYDELECDLTSGKVNRSLDCKKLGLALLPFTRPDKSNYSYKEYMRLIDTVVGLRSLSNYIISYPGCYIGDKKEEIVECTNKAIQLCDKVCIPSERVFDVYKNHTDCGYAYYLSWYQELKAGLAIELKQDYKFDLFEFDEEKGSLCKPVVIDKNGLKIFGAMISNICIYLDRISEIDEAIKEKEKTDPSFYVKWQKDR